MTKLNLPNLWDLSFLGRLRRELLFYFGALLLFWIGTFFLFPKIFPYLLFPYFHLLSNQSLIFISLEEAFLVVLRASFYIALALTLPFLVYRLYKAISSDLYPYEQRLLKSLFFLSLILSLMGIFLGYFVFTPYFLKIFLYFGQNFANNLRIESFLFFLLKIVLFSAVLFQIPLFFALFIKEDIISWELYKRKKLYFWLGFYSLSLLFSSGDIIGQFFLTLFFFLFFKLSFVIAKFLK